MAESTTVNRRSTSSPWRTLGSVFVCFASLGIVTVMLGPLLPGLMHRWQLEDAAAGTLFRSFFAGQFAGSWFAGRNLRLSLIGGAALVAVGCCALTWTGFGAAHIALFVCGLGLGAALTAGNVITGTSTAERARALALLNVSWSVGAIASPLLVHVTGGNFFVVTAAMVSAAGLVVALAQPAMGRSSVETAASPPLSLSWQKILGFGLSMMLFVGSESALGGWLPSFAVRCGVGGNGAVIALWYWVAEFAGRLLLATLAPRVARPVVYRVLLATLLAAQTALLVPGHPGGWMIAAIAVVDGTCLGPLYPLIVAFLLARTGQHPRLGALFAISALGGLLLPWFTGVASTHFGSLRLGFIVPMAAVAAMLALSWIAVGNGTRPGSESIQADAT